DIAGQLRQTAQGCRAMITEWTRLVERLDRVGWLESNQRFLGLYLLSKSPLQIFTDPVVTDWTAAYLGTLGSRSEADRAFQIVQYDRPPTMDDDILGRYVDLMMATLPGKAAGIVRMKAVAQAAIAELTERAGLLEARDERDRLIAIEKAHFDASKDAA